MVALPSLVAVVVALAACSERGTRSSSAKQPDPARPLAPAAPLDAALVVGAVTDAPPTPATLDDALAALRTRELTAAADHIHSRVAQREPKMRLSPPEAHAAALALLAVADRQPIRELHAVMPRSTIELARAVSERGVPLAEAEAIASYLVTLVGALRFERLGVFDENHSHVIGREWDEIDYSGESMTWQSQRDYWTPRGVVSFERAAHIHAYFAGAERLPHWNRVYKPRGRLADIAAPSR